MITECRCSTTVEAKLDVDSNKVICQNCGEIIELTEFMKSSMKSNGDIIRKTGTNTMIPEGGMLVECKNSKCNNKFAALLEKKDDECYCPKCHDKLELNVFSKALLKENGQYLGYANIEKPVINDVEIE